MIPHWLPPPPASPLSLFPMKSAWAVTEHAAKIDSLTYYLLLFVSLYNVMLESHLYNKMTLLRSFRGLGDVTIISTSPDQQTLYFVRFSIFFWHQRVFLTAELRELLFGHQFMELQMSLKPTRPANAFKSNLYNSNMLFFMEGSDCKITDSPYKESRWSIGSRSHKMDIHLYIFSIKCSVITTSSSYTYDAILHLISIWFYAAFRWILIWFSSSRSELLSFYELVNQNLLTFLSWNLNDKGSISRCVSWQTVRFLRRFSTSKE